MEDPFSCLNRREGRDIKPATGKLGCCSRAWARWPPPRGRCRGGPRKLALPIGSLTQMGTVRLGKRTENRSPLIKDFVPLARLEDLGFGGWDVYPDSAYEAAKKAGVLEDSHLAPLKDVLEGVKPWPAVFDPQYVKKLEGRDARRGRTSATWPTRSATTSRGSRRRRRSTGW